MSPPESTSSMAEPLSETGPLIDPKDYTDVPHTDTEEVKVKGTPMEVWLHEARLVVRLALPTVFINVTTMIPSVLMCSYIGRFEGEVALSGMMLGFSVLNVAFVAVITGLLSAVDTLCPQAFGATNYPEVGAVTLRGLIVCLTYSIIPLYLTVTDMKGLLSNTLGLNEGATEYAVSFARIWLPTLPFYISFVLIWKFLSAQETIYPLVYAGMIASFIILPSCIQIFGSAMGFDGVILAYDVFQVTEVLMALFFIYQFQAFVPATWSSVEPLSEKFKRALDKKRLLYFCKLALGGVVATTEWWFWEVLCVLVGKFGVDALSAHAVATQYISISFMFVMGFSLAINVRIGSTLSSNAHRAKFICYWGFAAGFGMSIIFAILFGTFKEAIISMFTDSKDVITLCNIVWPYMSIYIFHICLFAMNIGIVNAIGYQWIMGGGVLVVLWVFTLPTIYYATFFKGGGFVALWKILYIPYFFMNVFFLFLLVSIDWDSLGSEVKARHLKEVHEASLHATERSSGYGSLSAASSPSSSFVSSIDV